MNNVRSGNSSPWLKTNGFSCHKAYKIGFGNGTFLVCSSTCGVCLQDNNIVSVKSLAINNQVKSYSLDLVKTYTSVVLKTVPIIITSIDLIGYTESKSFVIIADYKNILLPLDNGTYDATRMDFILVITD